MKTTIWEFDIVLMVSNNACNCCTSEAGFKYQEESLYSKKRKLHLNRNGLFTDSSKRKLFLFFPNQRNHLKSKWGGSNTHKSHLNILFCWFLQNTIWMPVKSTPSRLGVYRMLPLSLLSVFAKGSILACICTSALAASWEDCLQKLVLQSSHTSFICTFKKNSELTGSSEKWRGTIH